MTTLLNHPDRHRDRARRPGAAVVMLSADGLVMSWDLAAEALLGHGAEDVLGRPVGVLIPPGRRQEATWLLDRARQGHTVGGLHTEWLHRDGHPVRVRLSGEPEHDARGHGIGLRLTLRNESRHASDPHLTMHLHSYLGALLEHVDSAVLLSDPRGRIAYLNEAMLALSGLEREPAAAMRRVEFLAACAPRFVRTRDFLERAERRSWDAIEAELATRAPGRRVIRWRSTPTALPDGTGRLDLFRDVTAEVSAREGLAHTAVTDALTGLLNRRGAELAIAREIKRARRLGTPLSLALVDVDRFKRINDRHGHAVGDAALRAVGEAITSSLRGEDLVARWGGDEFLALFPDTHASVARALGERVRSAVANREPVAGVRLTVALGVSQLRAEEESLEAALERADAAMYEAKQASRDRGRA